MHKDYRHGTKGAQKGRRINLQHCSFLRKGIKVAGIGRFKIGKAKLLYEKLKIPIFHYFPTFWFIYVTSDPYKKDEHDKKISRLKFFFWQSKN